MKFRYSINVVPCSLRWLLLLPLLSSLACHIHAQDNPLSFGVVSQRSPMITAQYWNPILHYVSRRSGVPLQLKLAKTGPDHSAMLRRGEFDFIYSNHQFAPGNDEVGYSVIARPIETAIRGQIVVLANSKIQTLAELKNQEVVFPSNVAFVGYYVPMNALMRAGITVKPQFAGNQEGAMGQLISHRAVAAAVNSLVAQDFADRQKLAYRVLWSSEEYLNIPIAAHPSVPKQKIHTVQEAFVQMAADTQGIKILTASAALIKQRPPFGFIAASDSDFDNVRKFFKNSLVKVTAP